MKRLISLIHPANVASIRVAEKIGERFERMIEFKGMQVRVYAMDHPEDR
ncbi:MAG: hypothetical protein HYR63_20905 [Proteobacteria bacterium]|nr:hypothetical protein [Pseudomonadota bacterium]MBI3496208.1 hypothetical protein [Pseudomonadota bacterium]